MSYGATIIIEDDFDIQESLVEICRETLNIDPLTAATAEGALPIIGANLPAVVLLDLTLPDHDGSWVVQQIAERGWSAQVRVVVLSAQASVEAKAGNLGAFAFLAKPFSLSAVIETLERAQS